MAEVMLARERLSRDGRQPTDSIESGRVCAKDVFDAQSLWSEVSKNYKNSGRVDSDAAYIAIYIDTFARWGAGAWLRGRRLQRQQEVEGKRELQMKRNRRNDWVLGGMRGGPSIVVYAMVNTDLQLWIGSFCNCLLFACCPPRRQTSRGSAFCHLQRHGSK